MARLLAVHPVIAVGDVRATALWLHTNLGFEPLFADDDGEPGYAASAVMAWSCTSAFTAMMSGPPG